MNERSELEFKCDDFMLFFACEAQAFFYQFNSNVLLLRHKLCIKEKGEQRVRPVDEQLTNFVCWSLRRNLKIRKALKSFNWGDTGEYRTIACHCQT